MTREQLLQMPISQLKGLDITNKEDELLVQEVLAEKLQNIPHVDPNRIILPPEATDSMTPQKEVELQAKLNGTPTVKKFCEFCDAKGPVKHKKNCTKPK